VPAAQCLYCPLYTGDGEIAAGEHGELLSSVNDDAGHISFRLQFIKDSYNCHCVLIIALH